MRSEVVVLCALVGIVALFAVTLMRTTSRRERLLRNVREVQHVFLSGRAEALKSKQQVVVWVDVKGRRILTWADSTPNFLQDAGEPTLNEYRVPPDLLFRYAPGGEAADGPGAVCFDEYLGNSSLVDRVVFRADGALVPPQRPECREPRAPRRLSATVPVGSIDCNPGNRCRGIYLSEGASGSKPQNTFRVGVNDPRQPEPVTILKWLPLSYGGNPGETDFVPAPWKWMDP